MTLYSLVLFGHVTAVLALFACLSLETLSLFHLRRASTLPEVQLWIEPVPGLSAVALGSLLVILLSGVYLTIQMSGFGLAWLKVTIAAFLLMAPLPFLAETLGANRSNGVNRVCRDYFRLAR